MNSIIKYLILYMLTFLLIACSKKKENLTSDSSNQFWLDSNMYAVNKNFSSQRDSFKLFLGIISPEKVELSESDTIITFCYDYSYAASFAGKFCQIIKTDSGIFFTQVFYKRRPAKNQFEKGFQFVNFLTNAPLSGQVFAEKFEKYPLEKKNWLRLISEIEKRKFFYKIESDTSPEVLDGTSASVSFYSLDRKHEVWRNNLVEGDFYKLCKLIDSYSVDTLDNF